MPQLFRVEHVENCPYTPNPYNHGPQHVLGDCDCPRPRYGSVNCSPRTDEQLGLSRIERETERKMYGYSFDSKLYLNIRPHEIVGVTAHQFDAWWSEVEKPTFDYQCETGIYVLEDRCGFTCTEDELPALSDHPKYHYPRRVCPKCGESDTIYPRMQYIIDRNLYANFGWRIVEYAVPLWAARYGNYQCVFDPTEATRVDVSTNYERFMKCG